MYFKKINGRLHSIVVPYLFWNVFWLIYNLLKTYKLHDTPDSELLEISSFGDFFSCFWKRGYGMDPNFPISYISADGISLVASDTPYYNLISSRFFLSDACLSGLFLLSGYLFFKNIFGGDCLKTHSSQNVS